MAEKTKKKHTVRNIILIVLAVIIVGLGIGALISGFSGSNNLAGEWKVVGLQTGFTDLNEKNASYDFINEDSSKALYANFDKSENTLTIYNKTEKNEVNNVYFKLPYYGYNQYNDIKTTKFTFSGTSIAWHVQNNYEKNDEYVYIQYGGYYSREYYGDQEHLQTEINDYKGDYITRFSLVKEDYDYKSNVKLDEISAGTTYTNKVKSTGDLTIKEINKIVQDGETVYKGTFNFEKSDEEFVIDLGKDGFYHLLSNHGNYVDSYIIIKADSNKIVLRPNTKSTYNGVAISSSEDLYSYLYTYVK